MRPRANGHRLIIGSLVALVAASAALVLTGLHYWHQPEYWLVGIPGYFTAIGTVGLAGATFRLIQREGLDRAQTAEALAHSQVMATEAARHRRDDRARQLRIAHYQGTRVSSTEDVRSIVSEGATFDMPKDANTMLYVSQALTIDAADGGSIEIIPNGLWIQGKRTFGRETAVVPFAQSGPSVAWFTAGRTVAEWVQVAESREAGQAGDELRATIGVNDNYDDGVVDTYEIVMGGCPLRRSPDREGQWIVDTGYQPTGFKSVVVKPMPLRRSYFVSKRGNEPL
jgi:hypothetical protein